MPATPEEVVSRVGLAIQERRLQINLTQEELASRSDMHRSFISDVERGARNLSLMSLQRLANALDTPSWELLRKAELSRPLGKQRRDLSRRR